MNNFSSHSEQIGFSATPLFGPEAGGTKIDIRYGFVQNEARETFPNVQVTLGDTQLDVNEE